MLGSCELGSTSTNAKAEICGYFHKRLPCYQPAEEGELSGFCNALLATFLQLRLAARILTIETPERHLREAEESFRTIRNGSSSESLRLARKAKHFFSRERGEMLLIVQPRWSVPITGGRIGSQQLAIASM